MTSSMTVTSQETCPAAPSNNSDGNSTVEALEERASRVVLVVQKCVEILRTTKQFNAIQPAALWSAVKQSSTNTSISSRSSSNNKESNPLSVIASVDIFLLMKEAGVWTDVEGLVSQLLESDTRVQYLLKYDNKKEEICDSRHQLALEVLLPLALALSDCYKLLDQLPSIHSQEQQQTQQHNDANNKLKKKKKKTPPPPPPGLLSLQNYTDIGAFLEFTVCTAILPFLQPYVLFPVEDRARYFLPKSLAGRISRPSLLWGCQQRKIPQKGHELLFMKQVTEELQTTVVILGKLLLLDRFRPMLLPRHLSDLYAAIFQAEAYTMRMQQIIQKQKDISADTSTATDPSLAHDFQNMVAQLLPKGMNALSPPRANDNHSTIIDPALQAQALQTLLLQGTKAPFWLKQKVAKHLTDMATQNLSVIIHVFVHAAPPKDKTAASLRLARTLLTPQQQQQPTTTSPTANSNTPNHESSAKYHNSLCHQIIQLLDTTVEECYRNKVPCGHADSLTSKQTLDIHAVWAILEQLPRNQMQDYMLCHFRKGLLLPNDSNGTMKEDDTYIIHQTVNRIAVLLSSIPPSHNPAKIALLLLMPLELVEEEGEKGGETRSTIFGQLSRLSSLRPSVLKSSFHDDVVLAMKLALQVILQSNFADDAGCDNNANDTSSNNNTVNSVEVLAMAMLYAAAPSNWDNSGYSYSVETQLTPASSSTTIISLCHIRIVQTQKHPPCQEEIMSGLESRITLILDKLLVPILEDNVQDSENDEEWRHEIIASKLFHLVLLLYFSSNAPKRPQQARNVKSMLPALFDQTKSKAGLFRIVAMCFLPLLCEKCPIESLLKTSRDDGAGIFGLMQLVFSCAGPYFAGGKVIMESNVLEKEGAAATTVNRLFEDAVINETTAFVHSGIFFSQLYCASVKSGGGTNPRPPECTEKSGVDIDTSDISMVLSVTSLVLGLLVAIMEHGTTSERSIEEEAIIASFPSLLQPLTEASDIAWMRTSVDNDIETLQALHTSCGEVAEMAGHAMALIAARTATISACDNEEESDKQQLAPGNVIESTLRQSMADLSSTQPPMRAKGIVSLQRLIRGSLFQTLLVEQQHQPTKGPLIVDLDAANEEPAEALVDKTISQIMGIAISAVSDSESYVYLAAIQCIAAAADSCPSSVIPRVGLAVATGNILLLDADETCGGTSGQSSGSKSLSSAQRVKLAEALIFCIRRRAKVDEYLTMMLDFMLFGGQRCKTDNPNQQSNAEKVNHIQRETHAYFIGGRDSAEENDTEDLEERAETQSIRVNTGGPIFAAEESDLVTAARVAVVSELLSAAHPSMLARYCHALASTAVELLRLGASRPVRRAAALLAREFYTAILREQNELLEMVALPSSDAADCSTDLELSTALMATSYDDVLHATLRRSLQADDLGDIANYRVFDSATVARCQEALDKRQEAVDGGLFLVARLVMQHRNLDKKLPARKLVRKLLRQSTGDTTTATVGSLSSLKVDMASLELE